MRKGQGSLEYLLILAAILAIAVVVVVVANSMLAPGQEAGEVAQDKYNCGVVGIELHGYTRQPTNIGEAGALKVSYQGIGAPGGGTECTATIDEADADAQCSFGQEDEFYVYVQKTAIDAINCTIGEVAP